MRTLEFKFEIAPEVKDRPRFSFRNGKVGTYTSAKTKKFENTLAALARKQMFGKKKIQGLIEAMAYFEFKKPPKTELQTPKKDLDNLCKSLLDALNGIAYNDDTQIYKIQAMKTWGTKDEIIFVLGFEN